MENGEFLFAKSGLREKRLKPVDKLFIVVEDLTTESYVVSVRPRQSVKSASTIKVTILHAFMIQRFRGNIKEPSKYERQIGWKMENSFLRKADLEKTIIKKTGGRLQAANKTT